MTGVLRSAGGSGGRLTLAWDTCTLNGTLALGDGEDMPGVEYFKTEKGHTGWLMPLVDSTMRELGASPRDIGLLAVGTGPGTFTGVKVGIATAKAVAFALGVPLVGVPTLDTLACAAKDSDLVLSVLDARRGTLYAALYRTGEARPRRVSEYMCAPPREIADAAAGCGFETLAVSGEASDELMGMLDKGGGRVIRPGGPIPDGGLLLELARVMRLEGMDSDAASVCPIYLKKPV